MFWTTEPIFSAGLTAPLIPRDGDPGLDQHALHGMMIYDCPMMSRSILVGYLQSMMIDEIPLASIKAYDVYVVLALFH